MSQKSPIRCNFAIKHFLFVKVLFGPGPALPPHLCSSFRIGQCFSYGVGQSLYIT